MDLPSVAHRDSRAPQDTLALPVDLDSLARLLAQVLADEGVPARAEASLQLVEADAIAVLNAEHLDSTGPTDVLSFPIDGMNGSEPDEADPWIVGDVVICAEVAAAQAAGHAGTTDDELSLLVVHGGLHLCGWDHATEEERVAMWDRERSLMERFAALPTRDPWVTS